MRMPSRALVKTLAASWSFSLSFLLLGNVLGEDDNAADAAVRSSPGMYLPAKPLDGEIRADEAVLVAIQVFAGQGAAMQRFPAVGDFGKDLIVRAADHAPTGSPKSRSQRRLTAR